MFKTNKNLIMARKKTYKGIVLSPGFKTTKREYKPGDTFETKHEPSYIHLINTKKIS